MRPSLLYISSWLNRVRRGMFAAGVSVVLWIGGLSATAYAQSAASASPSAPVSNQSQTMQGAVRITLDDAIQLALRHNHSLLAAQTTIQQDQALETQANLRPNPSIFADWEYLPLFTPSMWTGAYLQNSTEADLGFSYLFERGKKRQHRLQAAKDVTAQARSLVADNERTLTFNVASQFFNVQLAESTVDLATKDVESFRKTVEVSEFQWKAGGMSEGDFLMIKIQLLQYESDYQQAILARDQGLDDLRNMLGYDSVPAGFDVDGSFDYRPVNAKLEELQMKALQDRPDLHAAQQGVTAATSQWELQKADGKVDVTGQANYSHVNSINTATVYVSAPLPVFNRNQGNIAQARYAITQTQEQEKATSEQVMTDVHDAYGGLKENDAIISLYRSGISTRPCVTARSRNSPTSMEERVCWTGSTPSGIIAPPSWPMPGARVVPHFRRAASRSGWH